MQDNNEQRWRHFQSISGTEGSVTTGAKPSIHLVETELIAAVHSSTTPAKGEHLAPISCLTPTEGPPQRKLVQRNGSQDDADTPVRKTVAFTTVQQTHYCETSEDEEGTEEATPSPGDDAEEFRTVEALLAEKNAELAGLAARVARMEARQGALQELRSLQDRTAQLRAEMRQKEAQIAALKQHRRGGRRALLQGIASSVAAGVADCERRMAEEAGKWALRALSALNLKPISPATPEGTPPPAAAAGACIDAKSPLYFSPWAFPPVNLAKVQKGRFLVLAACSADKSLAFSLGGDALWLGKVEQRMGQSNAFKLHYYRQQAQPKRGAAGHSLVFEPSVDARGYPVICEQALDARAVVAIFDELECTARGGAGALPPAAIEEVTRRLAGLRSDAGSSADEHSPSVSLASWASPL